MKNHANAQVGIIMGSKSDLAVMSSAAEALEIFGIPYEIHIVSAHRTPEYMVQYAKSARERGLKVILAGAGGSAHLPGMVAALTSLPVVGVPVLSKNSLQGWDSILSILQMPKGVPVATVAVDNAYNAGLLAAQILGANDAILAEKLDVFRKEQTQKSIDSDKELLN